MTPLLSAAVSVAAVAAGATGGVVAGLRLGRRYAKRKWQLAGVYAGSLVGCSLLCAGGLAYGQRWFAVGALGLLAGLLTGTKYGARGGFLPVAEPGEEG